MRTLDELFHVYRNEFRFPGFFGENWPGFSDLMDSLDELPAPSQLTVIEHAEKLLADDQDEIKTFLRQLNDTGPRELVSREIGVLAPLLSTQCLSQIQRAFKDSRTWRLRDLDPVIATNRLEMFGGGPPAPGVRRDARALHNSQPTCISELKLSRATCWQ